MTQLTGRAHLETMMAAHDIAPGELKDAMAHIGDDALVNRVAGALKGKGIKVLGKLKQLAPRAHIEALPSGELRIEGQLTVGPERVGALQDADIEKLSADPFGAQHAAQPVRRIEQRDRCVRPRTGLQWPRPVR